MRQAPFFQLSYQLGGCRVGLLRFHAFHFQILSKPCTIRASQLAGKWQSSSMFLSHVPAQLQKSCELAAKMTLMLKLSSISSSLLLLSVRCRICMRQPVLAGFCSGIHGDEKYRCAKATRLSSQSFEGQPVSSWETIATVGLRFGRTAICIK